METRRAKSVILRYPVTNRAGTIHVVEVFEVGKKSPVPGYPDLEVVTEIRVVSSWNNHIEIEFDNYGEVWRTDYVAEIHFESKNYQKIRNARKADKKNQDRDGQQ